MLRSLTMADVSVDALRRWSHILLWVSIILPFMGALAAGGRYYVERYEKRVSAKTAAAEIARIKDLQSTAEAQLRATAEANESLRHEVVRTQKEFDEKLTRERARITSAQATVVVQVAWNVLDHPTGAAESAETWKSVETGNGAYVAFAKGKDAVLLLRSTDVVAEARDSKVVTATTHVNLNTPGSEAVGDLLGIQSADFIQIHLPDLPKDSQVLGGQLDCIFNGNTKLRVTIPRQKMVGDALFVSSTAGFLLMPNS